jgi:hypothetical protein
MKMKRWVAACIGGTITSADPEIYCAMANSGFDYLWPNEGAER